ncbi:MAG TPA: small basic protein [Lentisphaeria bacterium]|nr:small basic protein [Lentisphaeria bacterium]
MARHPSLKGSTKIIKKRNVLKRYERIDVMIKEDKWKEGDKALGIPKTKVVQ